jgi:phospholipid/cholesterol/gamma-HCH transport system permease protein
LSVLEEVGRPLILWAEDIGVTTLQWLAALARFPALLPIAGKRRRWRATLEQVLIIGARALPMACTMSLCVGFVLALQGASELRRLGALNYVVDLVTFAFTREMGALVTAIAVSGRSASAISAEVGTMVVTEEMDALRVMGLNPVEFTLAPKYFGALVAMPCLTILSTVCGIFAGYVFMAFSQDMSIQVYFRAVLESILLRDIWFSLIKSVVFATIIVQIGYVEGLRVKGGPEAVGQATTTAVVKSTFLIIVADLAATWFYYAMGWSSAG